MREIKFRAWNPENKSMVEFDNEKAANDIYIAKHLLTLMANKHELGENLLMQFTGLQDKNGVDIFEGDIVSMHTEYIESYPYHNDGADDFNVQRIGEVRIHASKGAVIIKPLNVCNEMGDKNRHKWNVQLSAYRTIVIGNIHSNPELLEK